MNKVFIGKVVNTHGVHGEFRILSDFERKNEVFKIGNEIIIMNRTYKITSYRVHKNFDMITVEGLTNLNDVIPLKGSSVFIDRDNLNISDNEYLYEDMLNSKVLLDNIEIGVVVDYTLGMNPLLYIKTNDGKEKMIPFNDNFIKKFNKDNKELLLNDNAKGLL